jgi:hypothetical protein
VVSYRFFPLDSSADCCHNIEICPGEKFAELLSYLLVVFDQADRHFRVRRFNPPGASQALSISDPYTHRLGT